MLQAIAFILFHVIVECKDQCTEGFMDYELLNVKASLIGDSTINDIVSGVGINNWGRRFVLPTLNFSCSGNITGFLLAANIRIDNNRNKYPWIGLYNQVNSNMYSLVSGSVRDIILGPDDFSTIGLYNYTLSSPIQFTTGNILGVRQPDVSRSIVRIYKRKSYGHGADIIHINSTGIKKVYSNSILIIYPLTDNKHCLSSGFMSHKDLVSNARLVGEVSDDYSIYSSHNNMFFKDIKFTCNGSITNVIVGMKKQQTSATLLPEIRIWRPDVDGTYIQSGPIIRLYHSDAVSDISTDYLRWYNLSVPVPVKEGDVLGLFHVLLNHESIIYHQQYNGPYNYYSNKENDEKFDYNSYPLVSIVVQPEQSVASTVVSWSLFDYHDVSILPAGPSTTSTMLVTTAVEYTTNLQVSNSISSTDNSIGFSNTVIIVPVAACIFCVLCIFICSIIIFGVLCYHHKKQLARTTNLLTNGTNEGISIDGEGVYDCISGKNNCQGQKITYDAPCKLNECNGLSDNTPNNDSYDYIAVIDGGKTDSLSRLIQMDLNDSYGKQQNIPPAYIEGKKLPPAAVTFRSTGRAASEDNIYI